MTDSSKIWFVYLTDHHEGPFTASEVAEKLSQGLVTKQSLGWKDGMAEWLAIESIPELAAALNEPTPAPAAAEAAGGGEEGFSLAQLLASQQQGGAAPTQEDPSLTGATSVLSQMVGAVHSNNPVGTGSVSIDIATSKTGVENPIATIQAVDEKPVGDDEEVWTMKVGQQVSGLYSYNRLIEIAGVGEVPADARFWRPGWQDFQSLAKLPEVAAARRAKPATNTATAAPSTGQKTASGLNRPSAFAPITSGANVGDDDPTDPNINAAGFTKAGGFLAKIKGLFNRKKKEPSKSSASSAAAKTNIGAKKSAATKGGSSLLRTLLIVVVLVALVGGGGAAYFLFLSSPIPSSLDVIADDLEAMKVLVKEPADQGGKFYIAPAKGTEDNPADPTSPKFYVATNLPEGTAVTLQLTGQVGTLVNRTSFEKSYSAQVNAQKLAVFEQVQDDGKPIPAGEYELKISAEGAEMLVVSKFLGGNKGGVYQDRLKKYKEKLQGEYDKEMQEFREFIETLKSSHAELAKSLEDYSKGWATVANRTKIVTDWRTYAATTSALLVQLDQKAKAKAANTNPATFHPKTLQEVVSLVAQMQQLVQIHSQRISEQTPSGDVAQIDGLVKAGIAALEQWLTQALVKSPFDVLNGAASGAALSAVAPAGAEPAVVAPAAVVAPVDPTAPVSPVSPVSPVAPVPNP